MARYTTTTINTIYTDAVVETILLLLKDTLKETAQNPVAV